MLRTLSSPSRITEVVEKRVGKVQLLGRYHSLPRKIEDDFVLTNTVLGTGFNGKVCMAVRRDSPDPPRECFAVKQFKLSKLSPKAASLLEAEVQIYLCMDHPHIARLVNVYETPQSLSLVMECMQGGELFDRIKATKRFPEHRAAQVMKQMLLALHYLHWHGIAHRDVKPENFLYADREAEFLKLIDFGFSKFRPQGARMKTACGTMAYVAPEVLSEQYTSQCDVWSVGVIAFLLLSGRMPFYGSDNSMMEQICEARYVMDHTWNQLSQESANFTRALLEKDPTRRLTAKQALEHEWIRKHSQQQCLDADPSMMFAFQQYSTAPKFRRCCLLAMAWLLTDKETAQVREEFCAINTDQQGTISFGELKVLMVEKFQVPEDNIREIFNAMDVNRDWEIHYSEFLAAMLSTRIDVHDKLLLDTFRNFDKDLSGYITADDLRQALGDSFEGETIECLLEDVNPSEERRMSFHEFVSYVRGTPVDSFTVQMSYPPGSQLHPIAAQMSAPQIEGDGTAPKMRKVVGKINKKQKTQACCNIM